jgi:hypothetical protein
MLLSKGPDAPHSPRAPIRFGAACNGSASVNAMAAEPAEKRYEVDCPHCHKHFTGTVIEGGAARYRGFKCPHCKLFVPLERVETQ